MKQLTRSEFNKQGTTYKSVTSPATDNDVTQITDIVENNGNLAFSTDGNNYKTITKEVQSVTDVSDIYPSKNSLPSGSDGDVLCALTNGVLPLSLYKNNGTSWEYLDQVRANVIYLDKATGLLYTFKTTSPYFDVTSYTKLSELTNDASYINQTQMENAISSAVASEATARENADTTLQNNITTEARTRANADTALRQDLDAEQLARSTTDTNLQTAITTEAGDRATADTALQNLITGLQNSKQDTLTAGTNITIENNVISAKGVTEVETSSIRIYGYTPGVYKLMNTGTISILYNGSTSSDALSIPTRHNNKCILMISSNYDSTTGTLYSWMLISLGHTYVGNTRSASGTYTELQQKLTAGSNVTISNDTISVTLPAIDDTLSTTSTNAVQNAVVTTALNGKQASLSSAQLDAVNSGVTSATVSQVATNTTNIDNKMDKTNPTGTGSLSVNRKANTTIGSRSVAVGIDTQAGGVGAFAEGVSTSAFGEAAHAEGTNTKANDEGCHAEGGYTLARSFYSHAEGGHTVASGKFSHAQGSYTQATRQSQMAMGEYNIADTGGTTGGKGTYIEIVGNGTADNARSNARTLDWSGNEVLSGTSQATGFKTPSGTSSEFLKADGSTDSTSYATSSALTTGLNGKQDTIDTTHKLSADLVEDASTTNKFVTSAEKTQISTNASDISTIEGLIPSQATTSNQLADKDFVNSSINAFAAYYITKNAVGDPFATKAELTSASTFYSGGAVRVPTTNDYCIVLADESKQSETGVDPTTRYSYQGNQWEYQYTVNDTPLTAAQLAALNSGITSALVTQIGTNQTDIAGKQDTIDSLHKLSADLVDDTSTTNKFVTANDKTTWNAKQDAIDSSHKLSADLVDDTNATNKFVTASDITNWNAKQNALTFDSAPTSASTNPVTSGGVYTALLGKQSTIDSSHKLSADLVDDTSTTNKFVTSSDKNAWNAKGGVYRGTFGDWSTVPTSASSYEADVNGNTTPLKDDYMILNDGSGKLDDSSFLYLSDTSGGGASISNTYNGITQTVRYSSVSGESNATTLNNVVSVYYDPPNSKWIVKTLRVCSVNNVSYAVGDVIAQWAYSSYSQCYIAYDANTNGGILVYDGVWGTDGKNGWKTAASIISMTTGIQNEINNKQATLVSGTNIKTINNQSLLGSGNITISSGTSTDVQVNGTSITSNGVANIVTNTAYNSSSNKIATMSDVPSTTSSVTSGSTAALTSGGAYTALSGKQNTLTFDTTPTSSSTNPVTSGGVYTALSSKQNALTFDSTPTQNSTNPVTSGGVHTALAGKQNTLTAGENITITNNVISASGGGTSQTKYHLVKTNVSSIWTAKTWSGLTNFFAGSVWTDGTNIYYSNGSTQYILDIATSTWSAKTWSGLTSFSGGYVWTDGRNIYYSSGSTQYVLDVATSTWSTKTWSGFTDISGINVWTDGTNIYCSNGATKQYVLDVATSTWNTKAWGGFTDISGINVWTDGANIYYSNGSTQYVLGTYSTWDAKTWTGLKSFDGSYVWTDGTNIYYSKGSTRYVLNVATSTWTAKTWSGMTSFSGTNVWTDGTNIYYSNGSTQYALGTIISTKTKLK